MEIKMSQETRGWKRNNILIGHTDKRGNAWWNARGMDGMDDSGEPNHYTGGIPVADVKRRLFNWDAIALPMTITLPEHITADGVTESRVIEVPNRIAVVRNDNGLVMGVFKESYAIHQYDEWLMGTIANLLDDDITIGNAGLLSGGAVGFVQVEVPENIVTPEGVEFRPFILAITSHNGVHATQFKRVVTNVVCDNTMRIAKSEQGQTFKVKHSLKSGMKLQSARDALGIIHDSADDFAKEVADLSAIKVNARTFGKFLDAYAPMPAEDAPKRSITMATTKRETITELYKNDPRVKPWNGTGWGVMQAINTYDQHFTMVKQGVTSDADKAALRYERTILGTASGDLDKSADNVFDILTMVTA